MVIIKRHFLWIHRKFIHLSSVDSNIWVENMVLMLTWKTRANGLPLIWLHIYVIANLLLTTEQELIDTDSNCYTFLSDRINYLFCTLFTMRSFHVATLGHSYMNYRVAKARMIKLVNIEWKRLFFDPNTPYSQVELIHRTIVYLYVNNKVFVPDSSKSGRSQKRNLVNNYLVFIGCFRDTFTN